MRKIKLVLPQMFLGLRDRSARMHASNEAAQVTVEKSAVCPAQLQVEALIPDRNDSFSRKYM